MIRKILTRNVWTVFFAVIVPMALGFGWQSGRLTPFSLASGENSPLFCEDGSLVKDRIDSRRRWLVAHLSEFGEHARSIWKNCVCRGFQGASCAALEAEISDLRQLGRLDAIQ